MKKSPGGILTLGRNAQKGKPSPLVNPQNKEEIIQWLNDNNIETLNIAGNREHTNPGIYEKAKGLLIEALSSMQDQSMDISKKALGETSQEMEMQMPLRDGNTYNIADINGKMLEAMGYTEKQVIQILKLIC